MCGHTLVTQLRICIARRTTSSAGHRAAEIRSRLCQGEDDGSVSCQSGPYAKGHAELLATDLRPVVDEAAGRNGVWRHQNAEERIPSAPFGRQVARCGRRITTSQSTMAKTMMTATSNSGGPSDSL
jgi:hypothetical protein